MKSNEPTPQKPLRLWPGVAAAALVLLLRLVIPAVVPGGVLFGLPLALVGILGGVVGGLAIVVWWLFFSRAPWAERVGAIVLMVVAILATSRVVHESIADAGMGMLLYISAIPVLSLALVAWAVASRHLSTGLRRASMVATILLACGAFTLVRTGGITGDADSDLHWRWTPSPEERLLARAVDEPVALSPAPAPRSGRDSQGTVRCRRRRPLDSARGRPLDVARGGRCSAPGGPSYREDRTGHCDSR